MHTSFPLSLSLLGGLSFLMVGCASPFDVGPAEPRLPDDVPAAFRDEPSSATEISLTTPWWEVFDDPILNGLVEAALIHNQDLEAAAHRVDRARALAGEVRADLFPQLSVQAEGGRQQSLQTAYQPSEYVRIPGLLSYELDLWGGIRRGASAARSEADAAQNRYDAARLSLSAQVAETVYLLRASRVEENIVSASVATRREARDMIESQHRLGTATELDLTRAETELALAEAERVAVARRAEQLSNALALLVGQPAPSFLIDSVGIELPAPPLAPGGLPASVLRHRPDLAAAEATLRAAADRVGVARAAFFPSVRLTASAGWESDEFDSVFSDSQRIWSIGPQVYLPVFQGNRNRSRLTRSVAAYEEQKALFRQNVLVALREVQDALTAGRLLQEQERAHDRATAAARRAAALSQARYDAGYVSYLEVVDSERVALSAERTQALLHAQRLSAAIQLIKALGGGWENTSTL